MEIFREVKGFIEMNKRNLSRYDAQESGRFGKARPEREKESIMAKYLKILQ